MPRMDRVGTHMTTVTNEDGIRKVTYHSTVVWEHDSTKPGLGTLTLRSGGYETVTTKTRMNQASNEYLGWGVCTVYQEHHIWYVQLGRFEDGVTLPFENGMVIDLSTRKLVAMD